MVISISGDVRARVDGHLDAVERVLREAGHPRERRRGIVDELEMQIMEMLEQRTAEPTVADVSAILATLDPPSAYGTPMREKAGAAFAQSAASAHLPRMGPPPVVRPSTSSIPTANPTSPSPRKKRRISMRATVIVTLIVCGTLMVMTPAVFDHLAVQHAARLQELAMNRADLPTSVNFSAQGISYDDRWYLHVAGCWAIVAGVLGGIVSFIAEMSRPAVSRA